MNPTGDDRIDAMSDIELLELLGRTLVGADPVPAYATETAMATVSSSMFEALHAELVFDSATMNVPGVRGDDSTRQLTFRAPGVEIEIMIVDGGARRLVGQLIPGQEADLELRYAESVFTARSDGLGRFQFDRIPVGRVALTIRGPEGSSIVSEWTVN